MIERFVWRLDCRLKYICYLLVIKFVIFWLFWVKKRLLLKVLVAGVALKRHHPPTWFQSMFIFIQHKYKQTSESSDMLVWRCEWIEGYILPIVNQWEFRVFLLIFRWNTLILECPCGGRCIEITYSGYFFFGSFIVPTTINQKKVAIHMIYLCDGWTVVWSMSAT